MRVAGNDRSILLRASANSGDVTTCITQVQVCQSDGQALVGEKEWSVER